MERLIASYIEYLQSDQPASEKYWGLRDKVYNDYRNPGVLVEVKKSNMLNIISQMLMMDVITESDLEGFSDKTIETVKLWAK